MDMEKELFLDKMERYIRSMNEVPVSRVSLPAEELAKLIDYARKGECDYDLGKENATGNLE